MNSYHCIVFTDLVRHSKAWGRVPRAAMLSIISEYRHLSQSISASYGCRHSNFTGDGHLFLFESVDVAIHFGLKLLAYWKQRRRSLLAVHNAPEIPIRIGCHFGECSRFSDADAWVGRAINVAKRVEGAAHPDTLFVTQTILELIDLPLYCFEEVGDYSLSGDFLERRLLYRMLSVDLEALANRSEDQLSAEDWFLKGVGHSDSVTCGEEFCYREALRLRPNYPEAYNNLGIVLRRKGDLLSAAEHYRAALSLWPHYPEAHYNLAILLESMEDARAAEEHYREAIKWRPTYTEALLRYASLRASFSDMEQAESLCRLAVESRPGYAEAHNNYANTLEARGASAEAEQEYLKALRLRPDYAQAHYNYAMLLEGSSQKDKAERHYRSAIHFHPNYAEAHNNLAVLLHEKCDLEGAATHYRSALKLRPNDPEIKFNFTLLAQAQGLADLADQHSSTERQLNSPVLNVATAATPEGEPVAQDCAGPSQSES